MILLLRPLAIALSAFLGSTVGSTLWAEKASPEPVPSGIREEVQVILRQVDFLVLDKDGNPIRDLRMEEVRVWDDGEEQRLVDLTAADGTSRFVRTPSGSTRRVTSAEDPRADSTTTDLTMPSVERRWIVLLFDVRNLSAQGRIRAGKALRSLIDSGLRPEDRVALLVDEDDLRIAVPFTTHHEAILKVLESPESISNRSRDMERRLRELRDNAESCRDATRIADCAKSSAGSFLLETGRETETSLDHLEALLRGLGSIPERKILFYVSDGFLPDPGDVALAAVEHAIGQFGYNGAAMRSLLSRDFRFRLEKIHQLATECRVGFYPINGTRKATDELFSPERAMDYGPENPAQARTDPFEATWNEVRSLHTALARTTGGVAVFQREPSAEELKRQMGSSEGVYTVSYSPSRFSWNRRKIRIKVGRPKTSVLYREAYVPLPQQSVRLDGAIEIDDASYDERTRMLRARVKVGGGGFVVAPDSSPPVSVASLFFEIRDGRGKSVKDLYEVIAFPREAEGKIVAGTLERPFALVLPPGTYALRVDVRDVHGAGRATLTRTVTVGPSNGETESGD